MAAKKTISIHNVFKVTSYLVPNNLSANAHGNGCLALAYSR